MVGCRRWRASTGGSCSALYNSYTLEMGKMSRNHFKLLSWNPCRDPNPTMSRNQTGGTELIPMPHPTEAPQLSLPVILYSALSGHLYSIWIGRPLPLHCIPKTTRAEGKMWSKWWKGGDYKSGFKSFHCFNNYGMVWCLNLHRAGGWCTWCGCRGCFPRPQPPSPGTPRQTSCSPQVESPGGFNILQPPFPRANIPFSLNHQTVHFLISLKLTLSLKKEQWKWMVFPEMLSIWMLEWPLMLCIVTFLKRGTPIGLRGGLDMFWLSL